MMKNNFALKKVSEQKSYNSYYKSEKGVIKTIYHTQVRTSKDTSFSLLDYTREDLKGWLYKNGFKKLYDEWVLNDYLKAKKPSLYRLNYGLEPKLDNLALTTLDISSKHRHDATRVPRNKNITSAKAIEKEKIKAEKVKVKKIKVKKIKVERINVERELNKLHKTKFIYKNKQVYLDRWEQDVVFLKPTHLGGILFNSTFMVEINKFFNATLHS